MVRLSVAELGQAVDGRFVGLDEGVQRRMLDGVTWDTRTLEPGNIFFAFPGQRVDGNDFVAAAAAAGAGAIVAARVPAGAHRAMCGEFACPVLVVDDCQRALSQLARYWRGRLHALVVGVTGSSGKTSTKEMIASVLSQRFKTHATAGNHNNELGVPATVLSADLDCEALVVEMGMRGLHQIEALCDIVRPGIGVVTNIGVGHMELLGSQDNIALAKSELVSALPASGVAIVNADDPYTPKVLEDARVPARKLACTSFGLDERSDVRAECVELASDGCARFTLHAPDMEPVRVKLSVPGRHSVLNALAASAVGRACGLDASQIAAGLAGAPSAPMRMEIAQSARGVTVVNDAYNANPDSMRAALDTLSSLACTGRRVAALGDMGELGGEEAALHRQVGTYAAHSGTDELVCIGEMAVHIAEGARASGFDAGAIMCFDDVDAAARHLVDTLGKGDVLLVKASRFMELERIAEKFGV